MYLWRGSRGHALSIKTRPTRDAGRHTPTAGRRWGRAHRRTAARVVHGMEGMKWNDMMPPMNMRPRMAGVKNPYTGHSASVKLRRPRAAGEGRGAAAQHRAHSHAPEGDAQPDDGCRGNDARAVHIPLQVHARNVRQVHRQVHGDHREHADEEESHVQPRAASRTRPHGSRPRMRPHAPIITKAASPPADRAQQRHAPIHLLRVLQRANEVHQVRDGERAAHPQPSMQQFTGALDALLALPPIGREVAPVHSRERVRRSTYRIGLFADTRHMTRILARAAACRASPPRPRS